MKFFENESQRAHCRDLRATTIRNPRIMKTSTRNPKLNSSPQCPCGAVRQRSLSSKLATVFAALVFMIFGTTQTRAQGIPPGCSGSAIGISLFTSAPDVHIGDTLLYSVSVFNG